MFLFRKSPVILALIVCFLFLGCSDEPEKINVTALNGTWSTQYDGYTINSSNNTLEYDDGGYDAGFAGSIEGISLFTAGGSDGVIYIKYTAKPTDFNTGTQPDGNFSAVYFRSLTSNTVEFANVTEGSPVVTSTATSLNNAKAKYNVDTVGIYVTYWGAYSKQ